MQAPNLTTYAIFPTPAGEQGTTAALGAMAQFVRRDAANPLLRTFAMQIVESAAGHGFEDEIRLIFEFVRDRIRFRRDPVQVERIQDAIRTLKFKTGDCDDKATLLATLLATLGHQARFAVGSYDGANWAHVWVQVKTPRGWVDLDATNEKASPGWRVPVRSWGTFDIFDTAAPTGIGFDPTPIIGTGLSVISSLLSKQPARQADERMRDVYYDEFLAQLGYLKEDVAAGRIDPVNGVRQGEALYRQWKAMVFALATESVRRSIGNKDRQGLSQDDRMTAALNAVKAAAAAAPPASQAVPTTNSGNNQSTAATGGNATPAPSGFKIDPLFLIGGTALLLLLTR